MGNRRQFVFLGRMEGPNPSFVKSIILCEAYWGQEGFLEPLIAHFYFS